MPIRTCPNTKCPYDKQLQPRQQCPLCGNESAEFKFNEFGNLIKKKDIFRKSIKKTKQYKEHMRKIMFCPKCGSANINCLVFYRPSIWKCLNCGYEGAFIVEDGKLAEKIQECYLKAIEEKHKQTI